MDYSLAALKLLCVQLSNARQTPSRNGSTIGRILFQRVWLQGVLVSKPSSSDTSSDSGRFLLDDGTGIIELYLSGDFLSRDWEAGMYLMVVGGFFIRPCDLPVIKVHKIVDLSAFPERESMWYLEVMEAFKLFYQPLFAEE